jgi:hypothetical protein
VKSGVAEAFLLEPERLGGGLTVNDNVYGGPTDSKSVWRGNDETLSKLNTSEPIH